MIVTMFPAPADQAKAIGVYGFVASAGGSIGLLAGGVLTDAINWHWILFINLPVGVATAALAVKLIVDTRGAGLRQGADAPGAALLTAGLMLGVYTILGIEQHGWTSGRTLGLAAVAVALIVAFLVRQARIANPLMPLRIFKSRLVTGANALTILLVVGMFGMFFLGALYLQQILGYTPLQVGLAFLPATIVMGAFSLKLSGPLTMKFGPLAVLVPALVAIGLGTLWFARTPVDGHFLTDVMPAMILIGAGAGAGFPALVTLAMSGATPQDAGLASGLVNTSSQVGGAIGLAVLATIAAQQTGNRLATGHTPAEAINAGFHAAYLIGTALVGVVIVIALTILRPSKSAAADNTETDAYAAAEAA
jgi:MFS family permease